MLRAHPGSFPDIGLAPLRHYWARGRVRQGISRWGQAHKGVVSPLPLSHMNAFPGSSLCSVKTLYEPEMKLE